MKRILLFAASAALLLGSSSCEHQPVPGETPWGGGNLLKTITLNLSGADTRSTSAAKEFTIGEATVFVYQSGPSGEVLYETVQTSSSSVGVNLLFTESVDYTYRFEAYANMGELSEAPHEVSFENESSSGFQMHGVLDGIDESSASSATVMLDRYVGRIVVNSVTLGWKHEANASQDFTLKRIWIANAAEVSGGDAAYNINGVYSVNNMEALLVSEVNEVIADGGIYNTPHYLYAYASGSTALVLECEWAGQTMYYHIDYEPEANSSVSYDLSIHQTGSSEPLGDITDDALKSTGVLQANNWATVEEDMYFGISNRPLFDSNGKYISWVRIQHVDGTLYTVEDWLTEEAAGNVNDSDANGVVVRNSQYFASPIVIAPDYDFKKLASYSSKLTEEDLVNFPYFNTNSYGGTSLKEPVSGKEMTALLLDLVQRGILTSAPAAEYCDDYLFKDGSKGFLPSVTDIQAFMSNETLINACMDAIGGTHVGGSAGTGMYIWTSNILPTDYPEGFIWGYSNYNYIGTLGLTYEYRAIPCTEFIYNPLNEFKR